MAGSPLLQTKALRAFCGVLQLFAGKDMGEASVFVGVEISRDRAACILTISQQAAAAALVQKWNMEDAKQRSTPLSLFFQVRVMLT